MKTGHCEIQIRPLQQEQHHEHHRDGKSSKGDEKDEADAVAHAALPSKLGGSAISVLSHREATDRTVMVVVSTSKYGNASLLFALRNKKQRDVSK